MLRLKKTNQFPIVLLLITFLFVIFLSSCAQQDKKSSESDTQTVTSDTQTDTETVGKKAEETEKKEPEPKPQIDPAKAIAVIETASGNIEFEFFATEAPNAAKNFIKNASMGYYRNEPFHEANELYLQAGSSFANETLAIEKSKRALERGIVLMAKNEGATVTDGDEFLICKDTIEIDGDNTVIGKVIKGLDILDSIKQYDKIVNITIRERNEE